MSGEVGEVTVGDAGVVVHIFTAAAKGAAMESRQSVLARAGEGLVGDRYTIARNRRGPAYELTLIEVESIEAFSREVDPLFTAEMPRRNIVTRDARLNDLCGRRFSLGGALCEGIELCEPCGLFARRTQPAVLKFFAHRGGLRARILEGGEIRVGNRLLGSSFGD